jgi:glycosyl transferase, family 25
MKAFVISLSKIPSSIETAIPVLNQLKEYGFDAELFEGTYGDEAVKLFNQEKRGVYPLGIKFDKYKSSLRRRKISFVEKNKTLRPGVIGCFYSHYRLWQKCVELDEPIFIFEDDVIFVNDYYPVEWEDVLLVCTGKMAYRHERYSGYLFNPPSEPSVIKLPNTSMPGAVGYGITPNGAKKLVHEYKSMILPADTAMNSFIVTLEMHTRLMGRAAIDEDGKTSLTKTRMWGGTKTERRKNDI